MLNNILGDSSVISLCSLNFIIDTLGIKFVEFILFPLANLLLGFLKVIFPPLN